MGAGILAFALLLQLTSPVQVTEAAIAAHPAAPTLAPEQAPGQDV